MQANGMRILRISSAPCENGSKTGMRRRTDSREKEDTDAILPVLKKADWRKKMKNRDIRKSEVVRVRVVLDVTFDSGKAGSEVAMRSLFVAVVVVIVLARDGVREIVVEVVSVVCK